MSQKGYEPFKNHSQREFPLGSGIDTEDYPFVQALSLSADGDLYVGGNFTEAGGYACTNLAIWRRAIPQPTLQITRTGTQYVLTWPGDFSNFALQQTDQISGSWSPVLETPILLDNRWTLTKDFQTGSKYFRLARSSSD